MTPEEQLAECAEIKKRKRRDKRDLRYFVLGLITGLAIVATMIIPTL